MADLQIGDMTPKTPVAGTDAVPISGTANEHATFNELLRWLWEDSEFLRRLGPMVDQGLLVYDATSERMVDGEPPPDNTTAYARTRAVAGSPVWSPGALLASLSTPIDADRGHPPKVRTLAAASLSAGFEPKQSEGAWVEITGPEAVPIDPMTEDGQVKIFVAVGSDLQVNAAYTIKGQPANPDEDQYLLCEKAGTVMIASWSQ